MPIMFPPQPGDTGWKAVTSFGSGWSEYNSTNYRAFYRIKNGIVFLDLYVKKSSNAVASETMLTLPSECWTSGVSQQIVFALNASTTVVRGCVLNLSTGVLSWANAAEAAGLVYLSASYPL